MDLAQSENNQDITETVAHQILTCDNSPLSESSRAARVCILHIPGLDTRGGRGEGRGIHRELRMCREAQHSLHRVHREDTAHMDYMEDSKQGCREPE